MTGGVGVGVVQAGIDAVPHEIAIVDASGSVVTVNDAWRRFADANGGDDPEYWLGADYFAACRRADDAREAASLEAGLRDVLAGERDEFTHEYPCHSPEVQRWFRLDAVRFEHGGDPYLLLSHTDVTERVLAEVRARARSEQLETVLSVLMHDLRNPLNVVDGYVAELAGEVDDQEVVETIRGAVARITEIIEATIEFSESGALETVEPLSVDDLAATAWRSVATGDARLEVAATGRILGDRRLLLQLFENLYRNAVEHAGPAPTVRVVDLPDGFAVSDDGPGLPADVREQALEADFSTRGTGGLGLAVVRTVVGAHGGTVTVGEADGGGALFECTGFERPPPAS